MAMVLLPSCVVLLQLHRHDTGRYDHMHTSMRGQSLTVSLCAGQPRSNREEN